MRSVVRDDNEGDSNPIFSFGNMVVVAGATGGVLAIVILIAVGLVIFFVLRNRKRKREGGSHDTELTFPTAENTPSTHSPSVEMVDLLHTKDDGDSYGDVTHTDAYLKASDSVEETVDTANPLHGIT